MVFMGAPIRPDRSPWKFVDDQITGHGPRGIETIRSKAPRGSGDQGARAYIGLEAKGHEGFTAHGLMVFLAALHAAGSTPGSHCRTRGQRY